MAGEREALTSPFAAKPSQLANPVPGEGAEQDALAELEQFRGADIDVPQVGTGEGDVVSQVGQVQQANLEPNDPRNQDYFQNLAQAQSANFDPNAELQSMSQRGRLSFATTDREVVNGLVTEYGKENVQITDRGVEWRPDPNSKWRLVDNKELTNMYDLADAERMIAEGIVENVGRIGGFVGGAGAGALAGAGAGAVVGGPLAPITSSAGAISGAMLSSIKGAAAAGAVSSPTALNFGDWVQTEIMNIERDPERNRALESTVAAGLGAGFNLIAAKSARSVAMANGKARQLGQYVSNVKDQVSNVLENVEMLNAMKLVKDKDGLKMLPHQVTGDMVPEFQSIAKELSTETGYRNFIKKQGEAIYNTYLSAAELVGNVRNLNDPNFADKVASSVYSSRNIDGQLIGKFRDEALKKGSKNLYAVNNTHEALQDMVERFGVNSIEDLRKLDKDALHAATGGTLTDSQAIALRDTVLKVTDALQGPGLSMKQLDTFYTGLRNRLDLAFNSREGLPLAKQLVRIKDALRDDWTQAIGKELGPESLEAYGQAMQRYSDTSKQLGNLSRTLMDNNISKEVFMKELFSNKKISLGQIRAVRQLVTQNEPELWSDMTGDYFNSLIKDATDTATGAVNWKQMRSKFDKLGPQMQKEIFEGTGYSPKVIEAAMEVGEHVQKSAFKFQTNQGKVSLPVKGARAAIILFSKTLATQKADTAADLLNAIGGKDQALIKYLNSGGVEEIAKFIPKVQRQNFLTRMLYRTDLATQKAGNAMASRAAQGARTLGVSGAKTSTRERGVEMTRP